MNASKQEKDTDLIFEKISTFAFKKKDALDAL